eukprot:COSAG06_NODE_8030_length_2293_cov_24.732908_3_plen_158_part_00
MPGQLGRVVSLMEHLDTYVRGDGGTAAVRRGERQHKAGWKCATRGTPGRAVMTITIRAEVRRSVGRGGEGRCPRVAAASCGSRALRPRRCRLPRAACSASGIVIPGARLKRESCQSRGIVGGSRLRPTTRVYPLPSARTEAHLPIPGQLCPTFSMKI